MTPPSGRPNILVIVMDCVRASDFTPDKAQGYLPFAGELAQESVRYTHAVSPASWTLPSHASLFTGLYPWEHGVHTHGDLRLPRSTKTLATMLRPRGYRSISLAANFLINSQFNLVNDFDQAYWGGWWEPYFRLAAYDRIFHGIPLGGESLSDVLGKRATNEDWHGPSALLQRYSPILLKQTYLLDLANHVLLGLSRQPRMGFTSPWIERTLAKWIRAQPQEQPVLTMVNLLDAHEPYFSSPRVVHGLREWVRYARLSQERFGWIEGKWQATPEKLSVLHDLYRLALGDVEVRLRQIIDVFKANGRWDNTLAFITSDHGQAFGEHGKLFHIMGVREEGVRIPLWVRYPHGAGGGREEHSWASLVDVVPTVLQAVTDEPPWPGSGIPLQSLGHTPRSLPVTTMSDGYGHIRKFTGEKKSPLKQDPLQVAAYGGDWKVSLEANSKAHPSAYRISEDPREERDVWDPTDERLSQLSEEARRVADIMLGRTPVPPTSGVMDRLKTWGYV